MKKKKKLCCLINPHVGTKCKECLVRSRRSYETFKYVASHMTNLKEALLMVWQERDACRGWRSQQTANKVRESIELLSDDFGLDKILINVPKEVAE